MKSMTPSPSRVAARKEQPSSNRVAKKWKKLPKGWTDKSVEKFWGTLTGGTPEHKVWDCIDKMTKPFGDGAGAFCGGLADWQMPGWRQKNKKESPEARSDAKSYWKGKMKGKKGASAARVALRFAQPLMTLPDYGHGNAAVPGDYHPCQHGGPCQCEGQCGCGKRGSE
jgi:hypothetical protein